MRGKVQVVVLTCLKTDTYFPLRFYYSYKSYKVRDENKLQGEIP